MTDPEPADGLTQFSVVPFDASSWPAEPTVDNPVPPDTVGRGVSKLNEPRVVGPATRAPELIRDLFIVVAEDDTIILLLEARPL